MSTIVKQDVSAALRKLDVFIGKWQTNGEDLTTTPPQNITAWDTYEWLTGGYALIHYIESTIGKEIKKGTEIIAYDSERKVYFVPFFDFAGGTGVEELTEKDNTWTWFGKNVMGVRYHRCIGEFGDEGNSIHARHEKSDDGETWIPWMNVILKKQII